MFFKRKGKYGIIQRKARAAKKLLKDWTQDITATIYKSATPLLPSFVTYNRRQEGMLSITLRDIDCEDSVPLPFL